MSDWERRSPAAGADEVRQRHEQNRRAWNQGAAGYSESLADAIVFLQAGGSNLHPIERANLGDLRAWCGTAIHLQCASGKDTLSLWNEGVKRVVGVDISDVHIANALVMTDTLQAPAEWHRCDILDTPHELDGTADLVYTGRGALCWIQDIEAWAAVVARLLTPGGIVHVLDDHPMMFLLREDTPALELEPRASYFEMVSTSRGWPDNYLGDLGLEPQDHAVKYERSWTLAEVVMALLGAGLVLEHLGEHRDSYWDPLPVIPAEQLRRVPLSFSLLARRPAYIGAAPIPLRQ